MQNKNSLNFIAIALFLCTLWTGFQIFTACQNNNKEICQPFEDFSLFYNAGSQAIKRENSKIYDSSYAKEIMNLPAGQKLEKSFLPFLYPPQSLPIISLLGLADYNISLTIWFLLQFVILLYAIRPYLSPFTTLIIIPFILLELLAGQNGMLFLALFLTVINYRKTKPIAAGVVLGIFSIKPQLAIFLPILLLYEKNWRVLGIAITTTVILTLISASIWGFAIWNDYFDMVKIFSQIQYITPKDYITVSASPFMAFRMLNIGSNFAIILQSLISVGVLTIVWQTLKKCKNEQQIIPLLSSATLLFSSYSYIYDDILLLPFCLLLLSHKNNTQLQRIAFIFMAFIPIIAIRLHGLDIPYAFISIIWGFICAVNLINRENNEIIST